MKYLFFIFCLILCSCNNNSEDILIGDCPPILQERQSFDLEERIDSIFIWNHTWHFIENEQDCKFVKPNNEQNYCDLNYCNGNDNEIMKIEGDWFSLTKIDEQNILVSVKQNDVKQKRSTPLIWISDNEEGKCMGNISITQSAE